MTSTAVEDCTRVKVEHGGYSPERAKSASEDVTFSHDLPVLLHRRLRSGSWYQMLSSESDLVSSRGLSDAQRFSSTPAEFVEVDGQRRDPNNCK